MKKILLFIGIFLILSLLMVVSFSYYLNREVIRDKAIKMVRQSYVIGDKWTTQQTLKYVLEQDSTLVDIRGWNARKLHDNHYIVTFSYETTLNGKVLQVFDVYFDPPMVKHITTNMGDHLVEYFEAREMGIDLSKYQRPGAIEEFEAQDTGKD